MRAGLHTSFSFSLYLVSNYLSLPISSSSSPPLSLKHWEISKHHFTWLDEHKHSLLDFYEDLPSPDYFVLNFPAVNADAL